MTLTAAHRAAICKVLPLLRADTMDTERLAALRAIDRILARAQAGWGDVAALVAGTRTETGQAKWSTGWEREWAELRAAARCTLVLVAGRVQGHVTHLEGDS